MRGLIRRAVSALALIAVVCSAATADDAPAPSTGFRVMGSAKTYYFAKHDVIGTDGSYLIVEAFGNRFVFPKSIEIVDVATGADVPETRRHDDIEPGYLAYLRTLPASTFRSATCPDCLVTGTIPASRSQYFSDGDPEANVEMRAAMKRASAARSARARATVAPVANLDRGAPVYCNPDGLMSCADCDLRYRCTAEIANSVAGDATKAEPVCDLPRAKFDTFVGVCFLIDPAVPNPFAPASLQR